MTNLFIDGEWFLNQKIFLIGFGYDLKNVGQIYGKRVDCKHFIDILKPVDGFIFFYGPDIGMIEKNFNIDIRHKYKCINLLRVYRHYAPNVKSYKLCNLEKYYGIKRTTPAYKQSIFKMFADWNNPAKKKLALIYNMEDVTNLIRIKRKLFAHHDIKAKDLGQFLLK